MERLLAKFEARQQAMLADAARWSEAALRFRPAGEAWCALDVLDHLVRTEVSFAKGVSKGLAAPRALPVLAPVRSAMVYALLYSPVRVAMPGAVREGITPQTPESLAVVKEEWMRTHAELQAVFRSVQPEQHGLGVLRHPVAGWMSARGALRAAEAHLAHHEYQWRRLRRKAKRAGL